jgi:hypothetical protein
VVAVDSHEAQQEKKKGGINREREKGHPNGIVALGEHGVGGMGILMFGGEAGNLDGCCALWGRIPFPH